MEYSFSTSAMFTAKKLERYTDVLRFIGLLLDGNSVYQPFWDQGTDFMVFYDLFSRQSCRNSMNRPFSGNRPF